MLADFRKVVRGEKYSCAVLVALFKNFEKFVLHYRVESARCLIENVKPRLVLKRADDADLFAIAEGKRADFSFGLEL